MTNRVTRLLVANRGEIARRIFRTCREMGIGTVAVYASPDAGAPFVREADDAFALGGTTSAETYLDAERVIAAALRAGADAVHPGYGFLSEQAAFAEAVIRAGLTWIGPSPEAITAMGNKLEAKARLAASGVPMLPSIEIREEAGFDLAHDGAGVALPALIKAAAGGGGRGMRIVRSAEALAGAIDSARREARSAFGDGSLFLERYLERARHIEIQVLGDTRGNLVHCFERECSIQRRHQKIVEEAPSPAVSPALREQMGAAALAAARAIGYTSAGTVEFLLDASGEFFFLEMNTRLQVEHPVTEAITGLDLVREQIRIAEGHPLSVRQEDLRIEGHAIEVRLYGEDPAKGFLPAPGPVHVWEPAAAPALRFDTGVESGSVVPVQFDPMIAKVIAHAPDRAEAAATLAAGLERLRIHGLTTNRDFLVATLWHPEFLRGNTTTAFIDEHRPSPTRIPTGDDLLFAAIAAAATANGTGGSSPWSGTAGARTAARFAMVSGEVSVALTVRRDDGYDFTAGERTGVAAVRPAGGDRVAVEIHGQRRTLSLYRAGDQVWVQDARGEIRLTALPRFPAPQTAGTSGGYQAPMPGKIVAVEVRAGDTVVAGQLLVILEAMKMEHRITAQAAGTIAEVRVAPGQQVEQNHVLIVFEGAAG